MHPKQSRAQQQSLQLEFYIGTILFSCHPAEGSVPAHVWQAS